MVRTLIFPVVTVVIAVSANIAAAQSQATPFPWRASQTDASQSQLPPIRQSTMVQLRNGNTQPVPPQMNRVPVFSAATRILQDDKPQPSLSDSKEYSFETPQATEEVKAEGEQAYDAKSPALAVQSNADRDGIDYCGRNCNQFCCDIGTPNRLFGCVAGTEITGFAQFGYHNRNTILFNDREDNVDLHQLWLTANRSATNGGFGYRVDAVYGLNGQDVQAFGNRPTGAPSGWDNGWDFGAYGWALPQAYVEYATGDTTIRAGKFLSPFGVERIPATENFFYSTTYTRFFTEPFSHSGIIAEQQRGGITYVLGATAGWDTGFESNSGFNLITGMRRQVSENVSIESTASLGDTGPRGSGTLSSFVANVKLLPRVNYRMQVDVLNLSTNNNDEFGWVNYLFYNHSACFGLGARLEWWKSDQFFTDTRSTWDLTLGANYRPHANFMLRPEVRMDWGAAALDPGAPIIGLDAIFLF